MTVGTNSGGNNQHQHHHETRRRRSSFCYLNVYRLRFIFAGFVCLWLLGLLHTWTELFLFEEEELLGNNFDAFQFQQNFRPRRPGAGGQRHFAPPIPMRMGDGEQQQQRRPQYRHLRPPLTRNMMNKEQGMVDSLNNVVMNHSSRIAGAIAEMGQHKRYANENASSVMMKNKNKIPFHRKPQLHHHPRRNFNKTKRNFSQNWGWQKLFGPKEEALLNLPKPIIVMGFPKAGTSSIFSFFQNQGLAAQHWYCCRPQGDPQHGGPSLMAGCLMKNLRTQHHKNQKLQQDNKNTTTTIDDGAQEKFNIFQGCNMKALEVYSEINGPRRKVVDKVSRREGLLMDDGSIDLDTKGPRIFLPQHFHINHIHDAFPNATWILNHRLPVDDWAESVMEWGDHLDYQFANEYYAQSEIILHENQFPRNKSEMITFLKTMYEEHVELVRTFVKDHPSHALVEITITDDDAGDILAETFGLDSKYWHHRNKNQKDTFAYYAQHHLVPKFSSRYGQYYEFEGSNLWWTLIVLVTTYLFYTVGLFHYFGLV